MAARDGSGNFIRSYDWTDDAANSIDITASRFDEEMDGIASELTNSVAADGQTTMSGALKMGGYRVTNIGAATALTDSVRAGQIMDNALTYLGTTGGTTTAYTLTPSPAITAYVKGMWFSFEINADNTGAATLAISGLTATNLKKLDSSGAKAAIAAADLKANITYAARYDGTDFLLTDMSLQDAPTSGSTSAEGLLELATNAEVTTGTDSARVPPVSSMFYHKMGAKAWVNFNGTGTPAIRSAYNISSITDLGGVGLYRCNFGITMSDTNYCVVPSATPTDGSTASWTNAFCYVRATTYCDIANEDTAGAGVDPQVITLIVIGNY